MDSTETHSVPTPGDGTNRREFLHGAFASAALLALGNRAVPFFLKDDRETVLAQDVIYVGGGSMRNLLAIWQAHGLDRLLIEAWRRGTVLAGLSAGAMCWFEGGVTKSFGPPEMDVSPFTARIASR